MRTAPIFAVAVAVCAILSPKISRVSAADLVVALAVVTNFRALWRAPLPSAVAVGLSLWVASGCASAIVALFQGLPERPELVLLYLLRRVEVVLCVVIGAAAARRGGGDALRGSVLLASGVAGLFGVVSRLGSGVYYSNAERMNRSFEVGLYQGEANHFGGLFALAMCLAVAIAWRPGPGPLRRTAGFALVACTAGLLTTGSRTALLAAVAGMLVAAAFTGVRATLGGVALVSALLLALPTSFARRVAIAAAALGGDSTRIALHDRAVNWAAVMDTIGDHPFLGIGPATRPLNFYDSEPLMALDSGGWCGLAALFLLFAVLWLGVRGRAHAGETGALVAAAVLSFGLVAMHVGRTALPLMLLLGAAVAEVAANDSSLRSSDQRRRSELARRSSSDTAAS